MELKIDLKKLKESGLSVEEFVYLAIVNEGNNPDELLWNTTNFITPLEQNMWVKRVEGEVLLREKGRQLFQNAGMEQDINIVLTYLNEKANKRFSLTSQPNKKFVRGRLEEGYTVEDLKKVIDTMVSKWSNDYKMAPYLRPETLFNSTKFQGYYNLIPKDTVDWTTERV